MRSSSLALPPDTICAFCAYLKGERPFTFVFRNEGIAVIVTREQRGNPHLLVIPVRHVETILGITDQEAALLALAVRDTADAIEREYRPEGISVWQNNGTPSGQAIRHLHFHVAGTLVEGGTEWGNVPELPLEETEIIARRLRPRFNK